MPPAAEPGARELELPVRGKHSGGRTRVALGLAAAGLLAACHRERPHTPNEHAALAAAFVRGDTALLRGLLHPDLIVQPPPPDSASRGDEAAAYLLALAAGSEVSESRLRPTGVSREGPFLLEEGTWFMGADGRILRARYLVRWRPADDGWKIVLLRWSRFR